MNKNERSWAMIDNPIAGEIRVSKKGTKRRNQKNVEH